MRDLNELRRKRGSIVAQMRALTDAAEAEHKAGKRTSNALTAEEDAKYDPRSAARQLLKVIEGGRQKKQETGTKTGAYGE